MCADNSRQPQLIISVFCMVKVLHVSAYMLEAISRLMKHRKKVLCKSQYVTLHHPYIWFSISFTNILSQVAESATVCTSS